MRNRVVSIVFLILICVVVVAQLGCERDDPPSMVLVNDSSPPCWFGICPGTTEKSEALTLLESMPYIEPSTIVDKSFNNARGSYVSWQFVPEVKDFGRLYYEGTKVMEIEITPRPKTSLSLGDMVTLFGEPEQVWAFSDCAESRWLYLALIYRKQGMYLVSFDDNWEKDEAAELTPDHLVSDVIFYAPTMFEELMMRSHDAIWPAYGYDYEDILRLLQPWQGYQEIEVVRECS